MLDKVIEVQLSDLTKKTYKLRAMENNSGLDIRLVEYKELKRESTRKRIYTVVKWYDWYNHRDRFQSTFIPLNQIELPQAVKQAYVTWLIEGLTFITTEGK